MKKVKTFFLVLFFLIVLLFFKPIFLENRLPLPSDTIVGLYHPFRDLYAKEYPRGIPFKNFLITDPVRQQYPWRYLAVEIEKKMEIPLWNPYSFAGVPLLANFQTAAFYPLNILFFVLPFDIAWTILIIMQPLIGGLFMFLYLRHIRLAYSAATLGALVFSFSGFSIVWMQWNTIFHVLLWIPLILLAKEMLLVKFSFRWLTVFILAETCAVFGGHLQILFYVFLVSNAYLVARIIQMYPKEEKSSHLFIHMVFKYRLFLIASLFVFTLTLIQWLPTAQFIFLSARDVDQANWHQVGWFIPLQHSIQFIAPDFFGNPTTLNYWGVWNYAEFIGYISIFSLIMAFYAILYRKDRKTLFFGAILLIALLFSFSTPLAKIPFLLNIPLISTSQPTRLLAIVVFSLSVLSALGLDHYTKHKKIRILLVLFTIIFGLLWGFVLRGHVFFPSILTENIMVAKRNLILPSGIFIISAILLLLNEKIKNIKYSFATVTILIAVVAFDFLRLGQKFLPFTEKQYLFPQTKTIEFLQKHVGNYRIMAIDDRILPPNFSVMYKLQSVSGYDPLYLKRYAQLIAASERGKSDMSVPFGFNRIITPKNYESNIVDLLGVKYILSLGKIDSPKLKKVFQEGETQVYENEKVLPRAFLVADTISVSNRQAILDVLFDTAHFDLRKIALIEESTGTDNPKTIIQKPAALDFSGAVDIVSYSENKILLSTVCSIDCFLVLTDTYYPTWKVKIDEKHEEVKQANFNFRGVFVPKGKHTVLFYNTLL